MNALTQSLTLPGPAGAIEALLDTPLLAEGAAVEVLVRPEGLRLGAEAAPAAEVEA